MPSTGSRVIIASAGSGKTTFLVDEALSHPGNRIAVLTYTNNNIGEIRKKFCTRCGGTPSRVDVMTWYAFLLHECARPYQRVVYAHKRIATIHFPQGRSARYARSSDMATFYFRNEDEIYSDKISRFAIECEKRSNGLVTKRIHEIYNEIFIDELQDLSGYDLDLLEAFLRAGIRIIMVGDPRQCTYVTNNSAKNIQYRGMGILDLLHQWETKNLCQIEHHARSYRCNQQICDFADALWPGMPRTISHNADRTGHDGVFVVSEDSIHRYVRAFSPVVLRYDRSANTCGYSAVNFGNAKGQEYDRVLIIPHGPIAKYLRTGDVNDVQGSIEKFYVAVTRARYSTAFLYEGASAVPCTKWPPQGS
jgi:DNA helicase-2/ATP-dependent DNA helicase PcrA